MAKSSHKPTVESVIETSPRSTFSDPGQFDVTGRALEALNLNLASQKEWAIEISVHPSMVSMWINGSKTISEDSAKRILVAAEVFALRQARASAALAYEINCYRRGVKP